MCELVPMGAAVQVGDPLPGVTAHDVAERLGDSPSDASLAEAIAAACAKAGHLMHLVGEDDGLAGELDEWLGLEERLWRMALDTLARDGVAPGKGPGMMRVVAPFMERNGYVDACGWWVHAGGDCENGKSAQLNGILLEVFPELKEQFAEYVSWQDGMETGCFLTYEDLLLPLARRALDERDEPSLTRLGDFIEQLMTSGDGYAVNVATVGLIEGLKAFGNPLIRSFLGPVSLGEFDTMIY